MRDMNRERVKEFEEKIIQVKRVSKKTKGGNKIGFSVLVVVGDKKGKVGVGLGKTRDVVRGIRKGLEIAKRRMIKVPLKEGRTISYEVRVKYGAAKVLLRPAPAGSGIIAGGAVRPVLEVAGIRDISAKILGTRNPTSNVRAVMKGFMLLKEMERRKKGREKK